MVVIAQAFLESLESCMALSLEDHKVIVKGIADAGYPCVSAPGSMSNPLRVAWVIDGEKHRYRLWAFDITHGGGGSEVRAADEFRIQITNGPAKSADLDVGATDLLIGYSRDENVIVAYDRGWLEGWVKKKEATGGGGSPSVQVKQADIRAGQEKGFHHLTKGANFGQADIVTMRPENLPAYLLNHDAVLRGTMTTAEIPTTTTEASSVVDYCRQRGFSFSAELIARYVASALTKPFVILAGVSGTGKSKLAELVAEYYSSKLEEGTTAPSAPSVSAEFVFGQTQTRQADPNRFALVPVRPDWIDNQSILGFVNPITNQYESTQALDLILKAKKAFDESTDKADAPRYFLLLDEMNLARVEHYFSDWLACTESRRYQPDKQVSQQPVALHRLNATLTASVRQADGKTQAYEVPAVLALPTNLIVTGTVNVDETTYGFSPKVLDRSMVLEFDEVDLEGLRHGANAQGLDGFRLPDQLPAFRLPMKDDYAGIPLGTHAHLLAINRILERARLHLGYRAANEMALFMTLYNAMLPEDESDGDWLRALDIAILQKVLPRLSGNRAKLESALTQLCIYLRDLAIQQHDTTMDEFDPASPAKLPKSYRRALEMLFSLRDFGFVSFFK